MATEVTLVCRFAEDEVDIESILSTTERSLDCDVTDWDIQEV